MWQLLNGYYEYAGHLMKAALRKRRRIDPLEANWLLGYYKRKERLQRVPDPGDIPLIERLKTEMEGLKK